MRLITSRRWPVRAHLIEESGDGVLVMEYIEGLRRFGPSDLTQRSGEK